MLYVGMFIIFALLVLLTAGFYFYPVLCLGLMVSSALMGAKPPPLPDPDKLVSVEGDREIEGQLRKLGAVREEFRRLHMRASALGIDSTSSSAGMRYDRRKRDGKLINAELDDVELRMKDVMHQIKATRTQLLGAIPNWRGPFERWVGRRAWSLAARLSLLVALLSIAGMMIASRDYPGEIAWLASIGNFASGQLLWRPLRPDMLAVMMTGVLAGYASLFVSQPFFRSRLKRSGDVGTMLRLAALEERLNPDQIYEYDPDGAFEEPEEERSRSEPWWTVLGVAADAAVEEIKTAYRNAIRGYHSDKVAHLGDKLKVVAEFESRRLNKAYETAKVERGFV
ncbi:J domain-containing protein [Rhizobium sp. BG4]|uniref:J domain-containing protein n=1 Tax=Rhizobium sp. BG4 TaxID=2613770 RepID=UPI00193E680A|nr:J domain-containing protein [Rhizobium sp. BG4]QRM47221.1 J domain-containing protein [Rhizobium sp. BG4]